MGARRKKELREFVVTADIRLVGATTIVEAYDEDEARAKAQALECDGFDSVGAELVDWRVTDVTPND